MSRARSAADRTERGERGGGGGGDLAERRYTFGAISRAKRSAIAGPPKPDMM